MAKPIDVSPFFLTSTELMELAVNEVDFYLDPFIVAGGITLLHGKFGTYKTPILLNMCKALATGEELWGLAVKKTVPMLFIESDSPATVIVPRMKALDFSDLDVDFFVGPAFNVIRSSRIQDAPHEGAIKRRLRDQHLERGYKVVFIDALRGLHYLDDKESSAASLVYKELQSMFPGAALVIVHHDRKESTAKDKPVEAANDEKFSGSQAWANHATVVVGVGHEAKKTKDARLSHTKTQAGPLINRLLVRVADGIHVQLTADLSMQSVDLWMKTLNKENLTAVETDEMLADYLGCTSRTAKRRRLNWVTWSEERKQTRPNVKASNGPEQESV